MIAAAAFFPTGCKGFSATGGPGPLVKDNLSSWRDPDAALETINEVVVMPFEGEASRKLPAEISRQILLEMARTFELDAGLEVLNLSAPEKVENAMSSAGQGPQITRASRVGAAADAQGVLYGVLTRYDGPQKAQKSVGQPSAAGFRVWLVRSGETKPVWSAGYERAEQPLSENLFLLPRALKKGIGYQGSLKLIQLGFTEAAEALKRARNAPQVGAAASRSRLPSVENR